MTTTANVVMDQASARRLTMRIRLQLDALAGNVEQVILLIDQAKTDKVHEILNYKSWTSYVAEEFGGQLARLTVADRQPVVEMLAGTGMSTRAIAPVVGVSHMTVARDLEQVSHGVTPADAALPDQDLDTILVMADATEDGLENALSSARAEGDLSREKVVEKFTSRTVTGTDGKTYSVPPPTPPKPRRRPLSDAYFDAVYDLEKVLNRLTRLHADDRFLGSRDSLRGRHLATVEQLSEALLKIEDELGDVR
ncbi:MAG: hypothetical protein JWO98_2243 [Frankiales bacterium]|nr:hypothetical protein [Frankiales bacterium]